MSEFEEKQHLNRSYNTRGNVTQETETSSGDKTQTETGQEVVRFRKKRRFIKHVSDVPVKDQKNTLPNAETKIIEETKETKETKETVETIEADENQVETKLVRRRKSKPVEKPFPVIYLIGILMLIMVAIIGKAYYETVTLNEERRAQEAAEIEQFFKSQKAVLNHMPEMVTIEGGTFMMGCTPEQKYCSDSERPPHLVKVDGFMLGKYEVTQALWLAVMNTNPSFFINCPKCPVESVSWNDVQKFIRKINKMTGRKFRLPTEAEWEFAARGGTLTKGFQFSGSTNEINDVAWYFDNSKKSTHPVGLKQSNELGIYDMSGNVWEWCSDYYSDTYYAESPASNPTGPTEGKHRIVRGGAWFYYKRYCGLSIRGWTVPYDRSNYFGFRLAHDL